ncbi:Fic family protein [Desulfallas sp. Bu1-1]|nr:Fic family protein [Desulfallas sp. Bu1-1]
MPWVPGCPALPDLVIESAGIHPERRNGIVTHGPQKRRDFSEIDQLKKKLDSYRPFPPAVAAKLREYYVVEWTHNSTAIEGNTLSLRETQMVLEGITVGGKTLREHLEIIDHKDAIEYIEDYIHEKIPLTETFIRNIHHMVLKSTFPGEAGKYREKNIIITGSKHKPPEAIEVPALMREMVDKYNADWQAEHPLKAAAMLHWRTTFIHPFIDGNGRVARLLMNFSLMQKGYPPVIFKKEDRLRYLEALEEASKEGKLDSFLELTLQSAMDSIEIYLRCLG